MFIKEKRYTMTHYLFGALPARLGDEMSSQAILLMGLALTQSTVLGSMVLAALTLSAAIGGPLLGAVLDRSPHPGRVLTYALGLYAIGIGCIGLSLGRVPFGVSVAIALTSGFLMPAISGGWSSRLKSFVAEEQMARASAIDATTFNIAGLAGPAIAGLIAALFGAHWVIIILIILLLTALPMAWSLPKKVLSRSPDRATPFIQDVIVGLKVIAHNKKLFRITLTSVVSYMGIGMLWVVYPLVGRDVFGNTGYGGLLASLVSVGALVATIAYAKWPTRYSSDKIAAITTGILCVAILTLAFTSNAPLTIMIMLIIGIADGPQLAAIFTVRHREAPEQSRSQVFTTGASLKITAAAIGAVLAGQLAETSIRFTILTACLIQFLAAMAFILVTYQIRKTSR
jgi:MFS family permease